MSEVASSAPRQAAFAFIFATVLLDMLALGIVVPVLPRLVIDFLGGHSAHAAEIYGMFGTVWALMQFLCSPLMGSLSDRFGRRPVILLSNVGLALDYVLMAWAPTLAWLLLGRIVSGAMSATISTAYAYISDVSPPDKRAGRFGLLGAAFGFGFVLGPAVGGVLGAADPRLPFWVAAGLSFANALYGFFILPESLPKERRGAFVWRRAGPIGALKLIRSSTGLRALGTVVFLSALAHAALPSMFVIYTNYRFAWDERTVGLTLAAVGVASLIVQGAVVGPAVARFGERRALLCGLASGAAGFAVYGLAATEAVFWLGLPVVAFWGLAGPATQALMSRLVEPTEQGRLQGANASLRGIADMIGPGLFTLSFSAFVGAGRTWELPGVPFLLAAAMLALGAFVAWRATREA
jgi:DHA1 family tetracycline resistance protein-like MFS transporter